MSYQKLKPDRCIAGFIPAILAMLVYILSIIYFGFSTAYDVIGVAFWIVALMQFTGYYKTGNHGYLISTLYLVLIGAFVISLDIKGLQAGEKMSPLSATLGILTIFFALYLIYLALNRKVKWKGREVFELAARNVHETSNGFTSRPRPAGTISFTQEELSGFISFLQKNLIGLAYYEKDRVVFAPVTFGKEYGFLFRSSRTILDRTWISFDKKGNITVNMIKSDYHRYKENLSFDQLCGGMAVLFAEFFEMYKNGDEIRIIDRLDALKMSIFA